MAEQARQALTGILERLPRSNFDHGALPLMDELLKLAEQPKKAEPPRKE